MDACESLMTHGMAWDMMEGRAIGHPHVEETRPCSDGHSDVAEDQQTQHLDELLPRAVLRARGGGIE